jgi:hypothetical protein
MEKRSPDAARGDGSASPRGVCERIRKHLREGAPWIACDVFRDAAARDSGDAELLYWGALAHAKTGTAQQAHAQLRPPQALVVVDPRTLTEI